MEEQEVEEKKILVFDNKMFYNARHLYNYLDRYYSSTHKVTFYQVQEATGKRLKSIDKFFKVTYEYIPLGLKQKIRRYIQINEGYEPVYVFETKTIDDFLIKYLTAKDVGYLFIYRTPKKELMLAFKPFVLKKVVEKFDSNLADIYMNKIVSESTMRKDFYHYALKPTSIKQNIF